MSAAISEISIKDCGSYLEAILKFKVLQVKNYAFELCFSAAEKHDTTLNFDINMKELIHIFKDKVK